MNRRDFFKASVAIPAVAALPTDASEKHGKVKLFIAPDDWLEVDLDVPLERQFKNERLAQVRRVFSSQVLED